MTHRLEVQGLYAAMNVSDLKSSESFYTKVLGRPPDDRPLVTLVQWRGYGAAGIQLFEDAGKAGQGRMTLVVPDMAEVERMLREQGLRLGEVQSGDFGKVAHIGDFDGNVVTFAEPPG